MPNIDTVTGYHGTTKERAEHILTEGFRFSRNDHDWLGHGVYFFERAPHRAAEWAAERYRGGTPCVIRARLTLRDCLDLTDTAGIRKLKPFYDLFVETFGRERVRQLRQTPGGRRFDCAVINFACDLLAERGQPVRVIREAFPEGNPLWADPESELRPSQIRDRTHVQLAVRDFSIFEGRPMLTETYEGAE